MIELVAFDMAGTTIDDHGLVYEALRRCVEETGAAVTSSDLQLWMGTDKVEAITALMALGGVDSTPDSVAHAFNRFREILAESYRNRPPIALPGVEDALRTLRARGVKVALTTGFSREVASALLESLDWTIGSHPSDLLDAVVTSSDVPAGRPAPYLIHHAMEELDVHDVRAVLAAGDTLVDVRAARNAGVIAVGVLTGKLTREEFEREPHDYVLDSVVDVLALAELRPA
jgi:phosphonatase-like hydrolase